MGKEEVYAVHVAGSVKDRFMLLTQVQQRDGVEYAGVSVVFGEDIYVVGPMALEDFRLLVEQCGCSVSFFTRCEG